MNISIDESVFDIWNQEKKLLNRKKRFVHPQIKEIWYIKIGVNIWREIFWKKGFFRPVLVISKLGNMFFCLPLTTKWKHTDFYIKLSTVSPNKDSYVVISQWRTFDSQRFFTKIAQVSFSEFENIKKLLRFKYFPEVFW